MVQQVRWQIHARPFVKWAGGKRQLLPVLGMHVPQSFDTYFEPFLGGGAFLFHMLDAVPSAAYRTFDLNSDLVLTYVTVRDRVDSVIGMLGEHARGYGLDPVQYYYAVRSSDPRDAVEKAARFLFLNRTCFNGLHRVNSRGRFNVPLGNYKNPNIVNEDRLRASSEILRSRDIRITCGDFEAVRGLAKSGDFVYFDPPYKPVSRTASFTSYTGGSFGEADLDRLIDLCYDLDSRGCRVLFSNSDLPEIAARFDDSWKVMRVRASRSINSDSERRLGHSELLVKNYGL